MFALILALAILVGLSLGLLGGGGSILTVPLLVYVAGQEPKAAIATSLLVVAVTSGVAAVSHARAGRVRWRTGLLFGGAGMAGAYGGGRLAEFIPGTWLLVAFGLMMAATAFAMLRRSPSSTRESRDDVPVGRVLLDGAVVGLVTGLVGAGGGFLVVPALALLGGLPMTAAIGTSLLVISMKSVAGLVGYLQSVEIDWTLAAAVTVAAVAGTFVGERLAGRFSQDALRRIFGWFVVAMAAFVLGQQVPLGALLAIMASPITWAVVGAAVGVAAAIGLRAHPWGT
ncbi:MAG: sulfite exporter TauE/SafE family protein [Nitriliruptorales bacterium]|nr:sulfite exporter TauE/SafE family protein [Nitriliruptorales bacterium]